MNRTGLIFMLHGLLLAGGCATPATVDAWRQSVEDYVWDQAGGDPGALRNLTVSPAHKGFGVFGDNSPDKSTDALAVLAGHPRVDGRPYFVYVLGMVDRRSVEDIRLAAMTFEAGRFHWIISPRNQQSLEAYRQYKHATWARSHGDRQAPPRSAFAFPGDEDIFDVSVSAGGIRVVHRQSGAQWVIAIPPAGSNE